MPSLNLSLIGRRLDRLGPKPQKNPTFIVEFGLTGGPIEFVECQGRRHVPKTADDDQGFIAGVAAQYSPALTSGTVILVHRLQEVERQ